MTPVRVIDTHRLSTVANEYEKPMLAFLRDLIANEDRDRLIAMEMGKAGFDEIRTDPGGSLVGRIASGKHVIRMEARNDARGAAGMAAMIYAGKLIQELGMFDSFTLWVAASARSLSRPDVVRAECILLAEPTNLRIHRGADETIGVLPESHPLIEAAIATYEALFELPPVIGKRNQNGNGPHAPTVGFGPGEEGLAPESVPVRQLVKAAQFYAAFPAVFAGRKRR